MEKEKNTDVVRPQSRAEAIELGLLIDVSKIAQEEGFRLPMAVSAAAWGKCVKVPADCQEYETEYQRIKKMLEMLRVSHQLLGYPNPIHFPNIVRTGERCYEEVVLMAGCCSGDQGESVLTVSLPEEA